jgi:hypothetical protein
MISNNNNNNNNNDTASSFTQDWVYQQPPSPSPNGGWFTGTPYMEGAPWRTYDVTPDVTFMINKNLRSANPPPGAIFQYPGSYRPGNNAQSMPGVQPGLVRTNNIMCVTQLQQTQSAPQVEGNLVQQPRPKFSRYTYLQ